jgi:hypothetical protein
MSICVCVDCRYVTITSYAMTGPVARTNHYCGLAAQHNRQQLLSCCLDFPCQCRGQGSSPPVEIPAAVLCDAVPGRQRGQLAPKGAPCAWETGTRAASCTSLVAANPRESQRLADRWQRSIWAGMRSSPNMSGNAVPSLNKGSLQRLMHGASRMLILQVSVPHRCLQCQAKCGAVDRTRTACGMSLPPYETPQSCVVALLNVIRFAPRVLAVCPLPIVVMPPAWFAVPVIRGSLT